MPSSKTVYLCGPINGCSDEECRDWREFVKLAIGDHRCIDPMRRDYRGQEAAAFREIVELDKLDVLVADVLLVNYDRPSVGTAMEVLFAYQLHKPVVIVAAAATNISPWLRYHSSTILSTFGQALEYIERLP